jgi:hypothetical protein
MFLHYEWSQIALEYYLSFERESFLVDLFHEGYFKYLDLFNF